jgi:hypothetical protein
MFGRVRGHRFALQIVAAVTLAGLALYDAILIVPKFGAAALVTGAIASIGIACLLLAFLVTPWSQRLRRRVEAAHG